MWHHFVIILCYDQNGVGSFLTIHLLPIDTESILSCVHYPHRSHQVNLLFFFFFTNYARIYVVHPEWAHCYDVANSLNIIGVPTYVLLVHISMFAFIPNCCPPLETRLSFFFSFNIYSQSFEAISNFCVNLLIKLKTNWIQYKI